MQIFKIKLTRTFHKPHKHGFFFLFFENKLFLRTVKFPYEKKSNEKSSFFRNHFCRQQTKDKALDWVLKLTREGFQKITRKDKKYQTAKLLIKRNRATKNYSTRLYF